MKKTLIAGLATIIVAGTALVSTGLYAANNGTTISGALSQGMHSMQGSRMNRGNPENMIASLSGKVSPEAIAAFQTLIEKHKTEMDAVRSNSGVAPDKTVIEAKQAAFKTEMDALMVRYPDLKTALPTKGAKMNRGNREMEILMATLPTTVQTEMKAIRDEYRVKQDALRTEEKAKLDTVLTAYPEIKTKFDTMKANKAKGGEGRGHRDGQKSKKNKATNTEK